MNRGSEFKVGLTVLGALAILLLSIVWLKEMSLHEKKRNYMVWFGTTGGLANSDQVQVNGLRRGQVRSMRLLNEGVLVDLEVAKDVTLTRDCRVAIRDVGLMGEKVIAIELHQTGSAYADGDTIAGIYEPGISEVMGRLGTSVDAVSELVGNLRDASRALNQDGQLERTISDFSETSRQLKDLVTDNRARIDQTFRNFSEASNSARTLTTGNEAQIRGAIDSFASAAAKMDSLSGRLDSLRAVTQKLASRIDAGDGTLGRLVNDQKLYDDLSSSVASVKALVDDIKLHPKKYFKVSVF